MISRRAQWAFLLVLAVPPTLSLFSGFNTTDGFLNKVLFGERFAHRRLPEVDALDPPTRSRDGYDGQFYAQIALSPLLRHPDLPRTTRLSYRARRIGMSMMAFVLGLGRTAWILQVYSALNWFFWVALAYGLFWKFGLNGWRDCMLAVSILWTTGTLVSVDRALTDLPAATVSFWGAALAGTRLIAACGLLSAAALFKETSMLSFPALAWKERGRTWKSVAWIVVGLPLPVLLWAAYVRFRTSSGPPPDVFSLPLVDFVSKIRREATAPVVNWLELAAPLTLAFQAIYLIVRPRLSSIWWRWGAGWAALAFVVGGDIWTEQVGYCRILLPLTIAFNVIVHQHEQGPAQWLLFVVGNGALLAHAPTHFTALASWPLVAWLAFELEWPWRRQRLMSSSD